MPRGIPNKPAPELNSEQLQGERVNEAPIPDSGAVDREQIAAELTDVQVVQETALGDYADELAFMNEKVTLLVHEGTDINAERVIHISCNGQNRFVARGRPTQVERRFVEVLCNARRTSIRTVSGADERGNAINKINAYTAVRYPFSVLNDTERGAAWLRDRLASR